MENLLDSNPLELKGKQRDEWLKQKQESIMDAVNSYKNNPEDIRELLQFMSQFHNYSFNNLMLIQEQWKGAYAVASYNRWKQLGFPVNEGEKGRILVWVHTPYKIIILENGEEVQWFRATKQQKARAENGELELKKGSTYKAGFVFDVSQTCAKPEDLPKILPNKHINFNDDEVNYDRVLNGIDAISSEIGTEVFWDERDVLGNAKGAFYRDSNKILLNKRNTPSESVAVSIHELAHALMHKKTNLSRGMKELQAELTAALVCNVYGLDTLDESVSYIHHWMQKGRKEGDPELDEILKEVQKAVKRFIYIIDNQSN